MQMRPKPVENLRALCDAAPIVHINCGQVARPFTLILPYYENPAFLRVQMRHWHDLHPYVRRHMSVIVVDDGSPNNPAEHVIRPEVGNLPVRMRLFRVARDVRWNWLAARNIGAHYAPDGWLMLTDMDHMIPPGTAEALVYGDHTADTIYRFSRREHTGHGIHPHPNSWFHTREMYWKIGGHDEALSGHYGTDGEYRSRCAATAPVRIMDCAIERHEFQGDSSTTHYKRKQPEDAAVKRMIRARPKHGWKPRTLSFPHYEVPL